jgi:serine/threonine protein kinase
MAASRLLTPDEILERDMLASRGITAADFSLIRLAGSGCNGAVFITKCRLPGFPFPDKLYAVKMVFNFSQLPTALRPYEAEFTMSAAITPNPFIVKYYGTFNSEVPSSWIAALPDSVQVEVTRDPLRDNARLASVRTTFGVFEAHVQSLLAWRQAFGDILPFQEFLWKGRQVVECEMAMLSRGLHHRDIKPDNYLVKADGTLCIADLGEAVRLVSGLLLILLCDFARA